MASDTILMDVDANSLCKGARPFEDITMKVTLTNMDKVRARARRRVKMATPVLWLACWILGIGGFRIADAGEAG